MKKLLASALLFALSLAPSAQALDAGVLGGVDFSTATQDVSPGTRNTKAAFIYGVLLDASVLIPLPFIGLEIDALVVNRTHEVNTAVNVGGVSAGTVLVTNKFQYLMVPAIVRFTGLPWINPGVGAYFAPALSKTSTEIAGFPTKIESGTAPDYGLVGSLQVEYPVVPLVNAILDGRYVLGLKDYSGLGKFRDIQILAGVSVGI